MSICSSRIAIPLLILSVMASEAIGAEPPVVEFSIPAQLPLGLTVPLPGTLRGPLSDRTVLEVRSKALGGRRLPAQRETSSRTVWVLARIDDPGVRGTVVRAPARYRRGSTDVNIHATREGLEFRDDDHPVMFYQREPHSLDGGQHVVANYVHPLYGLDGEILTQDFPDDHRHHHGVFWAWHQLWIGQKRAGDPWVNKDFLSVVREARVVDAGPVFATLATRVDWTSTLVTDKQGRPIPIVAERGLMRVFHAAGDARHIDFQIELTAQLDHVRIGGSEDVKGYSGFTVRMKPPRDMLIQDQRGRLDGDAVGSASPWADISGRYGTGQRQAGISILCDTRLPEYPPKWLLRHYGMQNVAYPGRHPVPLERGRPLVLRHRLVVHRGDHEAVRSVDQQAVYELLPEAVGPAGSLSLSWQKNMLSIRGPRLPGGEMKIWYIEAYCRPGSTDREWGQTVIGHKTELLESAKNGRRLRLRCTLRDGVIVNHDIRCVPDGVEFAVVAHNPTDKPSQAHWAQPCIRVGPFTGANQRTYLSRSFVFLDNRLTRMPTPIWATRARYVPGQVWCPTHVDRNDVNPRPLSPQVPSNGLIGCFSNDGRMIMASAWEPYQELFQGVIVCIHSDFRIGGLDAGQTRHIRGKLYLLDADVDALLQRYREDFPGQDRNTPAGAEGP